MTDKHTIFVAVTVLVINITVLISSFRYYDSKLSNYIETMASYDTNWVLESWKNSLEQINEEYDIVMFGDSITEQGMWQSYFKDKKILNLGIAGDTIEGLYNRVDMLISVHPNKVFIMIGINQLTSDSYAHSVDMYTLMIASIKEKIPSTEIYIQSILPTHPIKSPWRKVDNEYVMKFNEDLRNIASNEDIIYIDLYSLVETGGELNPDLTTDGIHLNSKGYDIWADLLKQYF